MASDRDTLTPAPLTPEKLAALRDHYDNNSTADHMDSHEPNGQDQPVLGEAPPPRPDSP